MTMTDEELQEIEDTLNKTGLLTDEERVEFLRVDVKKLLAEVRAIQGELPNEHDDHGTANTAKFQKALESLINKHSVENICDVPNFILAEMCVNFITSIGPSIKKTLDWHGCDSICHPLKEMETNIDLPPDDLPPDDEMAELSIRFDDGVFWLYIDGATKALINLGNGSIVSDALWGVDKEG